jgi:hypothetical protein
MKQSRAKQRSEYKFETIEYGNCVNQAGLLDDSVLAVLRQCYLTLMARLPVVSTFL